MEHARFAVVAFGDSSYRDFCTVGNDLRARLLELGASEVSPLVECDIDFEEDAKRWVREADSENAYYAPVLEKRLLTDPDYDKKSVHLSRSLDEFPERYEAGDSVRGVSP